MIQRFFFHGIGGYGGKNTITLRKQFSGPVYPGAAFTDLAGGKDAVVRAKHTLHLPAYNRFIIQCRVHGIKLQRIRLEYQCQTNSYFHGYLLYDYIEPKMRKSTIAIFTIFLLLVHMNVHAETKSGSELATFGGGCFWCVEAIFERVKGVESVQSGYSGGDVKNPTYKQVCTGQTGHAEVVQIRYDPSVVSFSELLEVFFETHDPTTLNRQGADLGTQYRSIVLYHNEEQRQLAEKAIRKLEEEGIYNDPIVTAVEPYKEFYSAEQYHQEYYENNRNQGYCRVVIQPKVEKFEKVFRDLLK